MTTTEQPLPYRDPSLSTPQRIEDLLGRMTLAEKAGQMFQPMIVAGRNGTLSEGNAAFGIPPTTQLVHDQQLTHFNLVGSAEDTRDLATWHNRLQELAAQTRLGIPISLSTDPRHHFTDNAGTSAMAGAFSQWPESLGLAAIASPELVEQFADIARQEYVAVGLRIALHPQIDLATEPRWARVSATFGEDAELTGRLVAAYIRGFQGKQLGADSVSTMTKHFPGGGPQKDGEDPHFAYGREQIYPGDNFDYHLEPFKAALAAGAAQMMPYYGMPVGTEWEEVGFAFSKGIITGLLREQLGFDGIVCTDWGLVTDAVILGQDMPARAWGAEHLSELERVAKIIDAGCDQFGGESRPELVVQAVKQGLVSEDRIDTSIRRLLREKFQLGLFDQPYVDVDAAVAIVGREDFVAAGQAAQRRAVTLLTNNSSILPLSQGRRLYVEGIDVELASAYGTVVDDPTEADVAIIRLAGPYEPRPGGFEAMFHAGSLEYGAGEKSRLAELFATVPTVVDIGLDRAAVIPEIAQSAAALVATFGSSAAALLAVLFGEAAPEGKLPFDLPSSTAAVLESRSDVPFDTAQPLFRFGYGLSF